MTRRILLIAIAALALVGCKQKQTDTPQQAASELSMEAGQPSTDAFGLPIDRYRVDTGIVPEGKTLGGLLNELGATRQQQNSILRIPTADFDPRKMQGGKTYYAYYQQLDDAPEQLTYWVYCPSRIEAVVFHLTDSIHVEHLEREVVTERRYAEVTIESSLWNAMAGNHLPTELALELSEIYQWTIDFFGLQQNDSIRVLYDERFVDDTSLGIERVYACHFYHAGKWQPAYYFEDGDLHTYFDQEGQSLRKAFLKAPLNYKRISSTFTYHRVHPVYKTVRAHTGVDYAAPVGTPVVSIGDGVVIEKGYKGDAGNRVKIKHNSTYTTAYLHLSKYGAGIQVGTHVSQGQVIGYVGSTGASTGPHLDFRVWKNGTPVDPLKMDSPPADPVSSEHMEAYQATILDYQSQMIQPFNVKQ